MTPTIRARILSWLGFSAVIAAAILLTNLVLFPLLDQGLHLLLSGSAFPPRLRLYTRFASALVMLFLLQWLFTRTARGRRALGWFREVNRDLFRPGR